MKFHILLLSLLTFSSCSFGSDTLSAPTTSIDSCKADTIKNLSKGFVNSYFIGNNLVEFNEVKLKLNEIQESRKHLTNSNALRGMQVLFGISGVFCVLFSNRGLTGSSKIGESSINTPLMMSGLGLETMGLIFSFGSISEFKKSIESYNRNICLQK